MADILYGFESSDSYSNYQRNDLISEYGGEDDLWNTNGMTLDDLNDPDFAVKFDADLGKGIYRVDNVTIEVFYEVPLDVLGAPALPPWKEEGLQAGAVVKDDVGQTQFVVCGSAGLMKKSIDGETWTELESGTVENLRAIRATGNGIVAVGDNGTIIKSLDLSAFTFETSNTRESLSSVSYDFSSGSIVTAGQNGVIRKQLPNSNSWASVRE